MVEERTPAIPSIRGIDLSGVWSILAQSQGTLILPLATAFACLVAWQTVAVYGDISSTILPYGGLTSAEDRAKIIVFLESPTTR